jgi:hypothetical protein
MISKGTTQLRNDSFRATGELEIETTVIHTKQTQQWHSTAADASPSRMLPLLPLLGIAMELL